MTMRKIITTILLTVLWSVCASAQEVVIDPTQIAASALNVLDQIDYAIDQIDELADMGGKLGNLKGHLDNVFGEDGIGGKAISLMQDLGTLERLTKTYDSIMKSAVRYAALMKEMESFRMSDVNVLLSYLNTSRNTAELAVATAKKILASVGLSKGEKKEELDKLIRELEEQLEALDDTMEIEIEATLMAEGLDDFMELLDDDFSVEQFVSSKQEYGERKSAAGRSLGVITAILMLLGIVAVAYGYVIYLRGGIAGDPTAQNVFIRIGVALFACMFILQLLSHVFHLNL